jgi:hypothetical protein
MFNRKGILKLKRGALIVRSMIYKYYLIYSFILALFLAVNPGKAHADNLDNSDTTQVVKKTTEPKPYPTLLWISAQLIPSPELIFRKSGGPRLGLRWQITPLLYSFGINKRLNPWRYLVVEPIVRQNGSIELFFTPEWINLTEQFSTNWLFRGGLRLYFPLYRYGEYLSGSLATSYYNYNGQQGLSYEGGIYIFFGILGLQATYSPDMTEAPWILTLRLRYF